MEKPHKNVAETKSMNHSRQGDIQVVWVEFRTEKKSKVDNCTIVQGTNKGEQGYVIYTYTRYLKTLPKLVWIEPKFSQDMLPCAVPNRAGTAFLHVHEARR
jgi:hypothetical protein